MFSNAAPYLYYGVSLLAWKNLLTGFGYRFITVESNGVNAFFVNTKAVDESFFAGLVPVDFRENAYQMRLFRKDHIEQFEIIKDLALVTI